MFVIQSCQSLGFGSMDPPPQLEVEPDFPKRIILS